jgi:hypothetical protein
MMLFLWLALMTIPEVQEADGPYQAIVGHLQACWDARGRTP